MSHNDTPQPHNENEPDIYAQLRRAIAAHLRGIGITDETTLASKVDAMLAPLGANPTARAECGRFEEVDLVQLWLQGVTPIEASIGRIAGGGHMFYRRAINWVAGAPGCGKSQLMVHLALEHAREGHHTYFIDMESEALTFVARALSQGATTKELERIHYLRPRWANSSLTDVTLDVLDRVEDPENALVVLDGLATAMAMHGLEENSNSDVSRFTSSLLRPIAERGPCVLVVDHVAHIARLNEARPSAPRGGSAKVADISGAGFYLHAPSGFSPTKAGFTHATLIKDRHGSVGALHEIAATIHFTPLGNRALSVEVRRPDPKVGQEGFIPSGLMQKLSRELEKRTTMTAGEAQELLNRKNWAQHGRKVLDLLTRHGFITVTQKGSSKVLTHIKPFSANDHAEEIRRKEQGETDPPEPFG